MTAHSPAHNHPRQRGAGLVEVMVAVVVLAIGLLGIAGMQLTSLQNNHSSALRSQAVALAYDAMDRMRANRDAAFIGTYNINFADPAPAGTSVAARDLQDWKLMLLTMPAGTGAIASTVVGGRTLFTVTVQWDDSHGVLPAQQFSTESEL